MAESGVLRDSPPLMEHEYLEWERDGRQIIYRFAYHPPGARRPITTETGVPDSVATDTVITALRPHVRVVQEWTASLERNAHN
jgi:hypothetical protein